MDKYAVGIITNLFAELKMYKKYENLSVIQNLLNAQITSSKCNRITINASTTASSFYGIIVYPELYDIVNESSFNVSNYVIEIQQDALDLLSPAELTALIIHDISHNVLTPTVAERLYLGIVKACRSTGFKVVTVLYNITEKMRNLAVLDISNRTLKVPVVAGTDMYEADRILVDLGIEDKFNSALAKIGSIDYLNLSSTPDEQVADSHMGLHLIKMVKELARRRTRAYDWLCAYIKGQYDTKVLDAFRGVPIEEKKDLLGAEVLEQEELNTIDVRYLEERAVEKIKDGENKSARLIMEAATTQSTAFGSGRISYSAMQKELDIINFKASAITSNYERLALLDRIYDNIFSLEKYLEKNSADKAVWDILDKFIEATRLLKDAKISKRKYGVFVEVPAGYEG